MPFKKRYSNNRNIEDQSYSEASSDDSFIFLILLMAIGSSYSSENSISDDSTKSTDTNTEIFSADDLISHSKFGCKNDIVASNFSENIDSDSSPALSVSSLPVILSESQIEILTETSVTLPEAAIDFKTLNRKVMLSECRLNNAMDELFLRGTIEEVLEYTTADSISLNEISGYIKKTSLATPFEGCAKVSFAIEPKTAHDFSLELASFDAYNNNTHVSSTNKEHFNSPDAKIFYNINNTEIYETSIKEKITPLTNSLTQSFSFQCIRKKMVLFLDLTLLQNQKTFILNNTTN